MNTTDLKRVRTLTVNGLAMFGEQCEQYQDRIDSLWSKLEDLVVTVTQCESLQDYRKLESDINLLYKDFCRRSEEYKAFLSRKNTEESINLRKEH